MSVDGAVAQVEVVLDAPPERVFALLTDVERTGGLGPENARNVWESDARGVGAVFRGTNDRDGRVWEVPCSVVEHVPPSRFAYAVGDPARPSATWSYDLAPVTGGTRVVQRFVHGPGMTYLRRAVEKHPDREAELVAGRLAELERGMRATLQAVGALLQD